MAFSNSKVQPHQNLNVELVSSIVDPTHSPDFERLRRQAEQRLDVLIGRRVGDMALDMHWPTAQLADALGFIGTGFAYFSRSAPGEEEPTEAGFFRREIPAALHEAREAMLALRRMSTSLAVLARDTAASAHIWSPAELMLRSIDLTRPLWHPRLIVDSSITEQENARLTAPARPILTALTEVVLALLREPAPEGTPVLMGLYRDTTNILHYRVDLPSVLGSPISLASRTRVAARIVQSVGGELGITSTSTGLALRLDLPEP
jgi:hypothetical protein